MKWLVTYVKGLLVWRELCRYDRDFYAAFDRDFPGYPDRYLRLMKRPTEGSRIEAERKCLAQTGFGTLERTIEHGFEGDGVTSVVDLKSL